MTLDEIKRSDALLLTCKDIAPLLKANAETLRLTAREKPEALGFPSTCWGNQVHFPRIPFLKFLLGGEYRDER